MSSLRHRQQLIALLDGKPASDWPLVIAAYNRSLLYDDNGNILSIIPFNASAGDGYIVLKNGEYDFPYTEQLNQEQSSQFWQSLGEQAAPILLGISEVIGGGVLWLGSSAVGAGGFVLALPSGGTLTIPAAAVASVGFATSGSLIAGGTIAVTDAISQIVTANANLQIRFAKGYDEWKNTGKNVNNDDSTKVDSLIKNLKETTNGKGVARNFESSGGYNHAIDDFESLYPQNIQEIQTKYGPGKVGTLEDGSTVVVRPGSETGGPTLEIRISNKKIFKIRY